MMLRKKRKNKPLNTFTTNNKLLHSIIKSKSTYFYKQWLSFFHLLRKHFINGFRWSSRHCEQSSSGFRLRDGANAQLRCALPATLKKEDKSSFYSLSSAVRLRSSRAINPYNKMLCGGVTKLIPYVCSMALLLVLGMIINPTSSGSSNEAYALDSSMSRSATVNPTLSMIIDDDTTMNPTYVTPGEVAYRSHIVKVSASDVMSYTLQITAASDGTTALKNGETSIPGTTATIGKNLAENTWGWSWSEVSSDNSEQTYYALPAYGSTGATTETGLLESNQANAENEVEFTRKLTFAANMSADSPSGHYTTTAMLSLAATPKQLVFDGISTMQEMTSTICANAAVNDTTRLRDTRDGNYYWVAKLADNNCWMTQNLALDLTDITLTPQDSDVQENWTPNLESGLWKAYANSKNPTEAGVKALHYYNPGEIVWAEPRRSTSAADRCTSFSDLTECTIYTFKNVSNMMPSNITTNAVYDESAGIYDAHYLVGNYYNANAATANTGITTPVDEDAPMSICASGWRLPSGYHDLISAYRENNSINFFFSSPLYFVAGGFVNGNIVNSGASFYYWSSRVLYINTEKFNEYELNNPRFGLAGIIPSSEELEYSSELCTFGSTVRCVAK